MPKKGFLEFRKFAPQGGEGGKKGFFTFSFISQRRKMIIHTVFALKCMKHEYLKINFRNFRNFPPIGVPPPQGG